MVMDRYSAKKTTTTTKKKKKNPEISWLGRPYSICKFTGEIFSCFIFFETGVLIHFYAVSHLCTFLRAVAKYINMNVRVLSAKTDKNVAMHFIRRI